MNKRFVVVSVLVFVAIVAAVVFFSSSDERKMKQAETKYADNPVMLYRTAGIKECGHNSRYKGRRSGAVRLEGEDLMEAINFITGRFRGYYTPSEIEAVLYINAPEADTGRLGQPALLPLAREGGIYCALGLVGSYSMEPFIEFKKKYQKQIER